MKTLKTSETLIEGLVASKQDENGNSFGGICSGVSQSFNLGKMKCVESAYAPVTESHCIDSYKVNGDVPMKGISLFVELKGEMTNKPDSETTRDAKNCSLYENRVKIDVSQQEPEVNVGDLVWASITKQKQSWWPGIVCDAANASKEAANRPLRDDDVLVRCFGNGNYIWCSSYEIKPFVGYFDQLPNQSKAKKFLDALNKAVTELGHRVKRAYTCSCFSNMKMLKTGNFGDYSLTRFEPAKFLEYIKDVGKDSSMAHEIDYVVKQSCLSAFYRSLGHLQIPLNQLKPVNASPLKVKTEPENWCFDDTKKLRDIRQSRILSYPSENGVEKSNVDVIEGSVDFSKASGQSQRVKKSHKKLSRENKVPANLSSSEVLSQLQFAAKDCGFQTESKNFDLVQRFISGFRKCAFNDFMCEVPFDVRKKGKHVISPALTHDLDHASMILNFGSMNLESQSISNQDTVLNFGNQHMTQTPICKLEPKRRNTGNADISNQPNVNHTDGTFQTSPFNFKNEYGSNPHCFTGNHGESQTGHVPTGLTHVPKKRGRKRKNVDFQANPGSTINLMTNPGPTPLDFTVNNTEPQTGHVPTGSSHEPKKRGRKKKNIDLQSNHGSTPPPPPPPHPQYYANNQPQTGPVPTMYWSPNPGSIPPYFPVNPPHAGFIPPMYFQPNPGSTPPYFPVTQPHPGYVPPMYLHPNHGSAPPYFTGNYGQPQTVHVPNGLSHEPKKRGRKRKNLDFQVNPGSTMNLQSNPGSTIDLQANPGQTVDSHTNPGSIIPNLNEGQKKQNRVKKAKEIGTPCIDLSYNKVKIDDLEVKGTAFLLKFSPDYPLPSNQDLNSAFSKFGELIESETQVSIENLSGQVVFLDSSSAGGAFWGLQNEKPFGPVLVNYKIQHLTGSESIVPFKTPIKSPSGANPIDSKAIITPTVIPELVPNSTEIQIMKRSKTIDLNHSKVRKVNKEAKGTGTTLVLKFSPNHPLPRIQDLNLVFCKYGELNEFETRVSGHDFTGQVVYANASAAGDAIQRLEKDRPFGPALLSYRVHLFNVQSSVPVKSPVNVPLDVKPPQDLGVLKKNLEMMNLMLEKNGNSLSPEMRMKLENEIKGLMNKVRVMDGSSSSSYCL